MLKKTGFLYFCTYIFSADTDDSHDYTSTHYYQEKISPHISQTCLKDFFSSNLYFIRARLVLKIGLGLLRVFGKPPRQAKVSSQGENMIILSIYKNISSSRVWIITFFGLRNVWDINKLKLTTNRLNRLLWGHNSAHDVTSYCIFLNCIEGLG